MSTKSRWLSIKTGIAFKDVKRSLLRMEFLPESSSGFIIINSKLDVVAARFVNKVLHDESVEDPFGRVSSASYESIDITNFSMYKSNSSVWLLRIEAPGRGYKLLLEALSQAFGVGVYVERVEINPLTFIDFLPKNYSVQVKRKIVSSVVINNSTLAKFELTATSGNEIRDELFLKCFTHRVDVLTIKVFLGTANCELTISRSGSSSIGGELAERLQYELTKFLLSLIESFI